MLELSSTALALGVPGSSFTSGRHFLVGKGVPHLLCGKMENAFVLEKVDERQEGGLNLTRFKNASYVPVKVGRRGAESVSPGQRYFPRAGNNERQVRDGMEKKNGSNPSLGSCMTPAQSMTWESVLMQTAPI